MGRKVCFWVGPGWEAKFHMIISEVILLVGYCNSGTEIITGHGLEADESSSASCNLQGLN